MCHTPILPPSLANSSPISRRFFPQISSSFIADAELVVISQLLRQRNRTLSVVELKGNRIGDDGACALAEALAAGQANLSRLSFGALASLFSQCVTHARTHTHARAHFRPWLSPRSTAHAPDLSCHTSLLLLQLPLRRLILEANEISAKGAAALVRGARGCPLEDLSFAENAISLSAAAVATRKAQFDREVELAKLANGGDHWAATQLKVK